MYLIEIKCAFCTKPFLRSKGQVNEAERFRWKQFCSRKCLAASKITAVRLQCSNPACNKSFSRVLSQAKKFKKSYCSHSCAAIIRNKERPPKYPPNRCIYQDCKVAIPHEKKYCSPLHQKQARIVPQETRRENILQRIRLFHRKQKRIPVKREMYGAYKEARRIFGGWNAAITAAGFRPNPVLFAEKHVANDGHPCDSFAERIIDDWLSSKGLTHQRSVPYPEEKRLTADFVVGSRWIEFFGLAGELEAYDALVKKKRQLSRKYHLSFVALYPRDLFPKNRLQEILKI